MKRLLTALSVVFVWLATGASPRQFTVADVVAQDVHVAGKELAFAPDAVVDSRKDLVRVSLTMLCVPHTAHRIDSVTLDGRGATDIDGVDFKRWFQFEDDGSISVEIDFPPSQQRPELLLITTNDGIYSLTLQPR